MVIGMLVIMVVIMLVIMLVIVAMGMIVTMMMSVIMMVMVVMIHVFHCRQPKLTHVTVHFDFVLQRLPGTVVQDLL